ncbi:MAG TPA: hypothetical protein VLS88_15730 [Polyangiales bacterium]|nr:hypothetical protein [Polyangiales bacterium]
MTRTPAYFVAALLALGCQRGAGPDSEEDLTDPSHDQSAEGLEEGATTAPSQGSTPSTTEPSLGVAPAPAVTGQSAEQDRDLGVGGADDETAPRDLSAELNQAVGVPDDCVQDLTRVTPTTLRVTVTALVRPSGVVIQPSVSGAGISQEARQCIARRVGNVVLRPLPDDVSQRVSTVIEIEYVPPSVRGAKAGAPDPELRNVREPLPKRPEVAPSGRPIQEPTSRPIQDPTSRPIQDPKSRKVRGPQPRPIDGWETDESSKEWR